MPKPDKAKLEHKRKLARIRKQNQRARQRDRQGVTGHAAPGKALPSGSQITTGSPQGYLTPWFQDYVFRKVDGNFYEALREGIPIFDAAIRRLISLNGRIKVIGDNMKLVAELEDFCLNVPVNDMQKGIHAFSENAQNETFEQGFSISEFIPTPARDDIDRLVVADSKNIYFRRNAQGRNEPWFRTGNPLVTNYTMPSYVIEDILNARYGQSVTFNGVTDMKLDLANKLYFSINNENQNPYGVAIARSTEFVAQVLVTLQNSIKNSAERFGDPAYHAHYKGKAGDGKIDARRVQLQADLKTVVDAKRAGKSGDIVTAGGPDSDVTIKVIGHEGQLFVYDIPLRHLLEQIVAKTNLPAWMLGIYWSTTERMATLEVEMALADAKIRQDAMLPYYIILFSNFLKLRGRSWKQITTSLDKKGDWGIIFETPNVRDVVANAQANQMNAQADLMRRSAGTVVTPATVSPNQPPTAIAGFEVGGMKFEVKTTGRKTCSCGASHSKILNLKSAIKKELTRPIPWPKLDEWEQKYEQNLKEDWALLQEKVFGILGLKIPEQSTVSGQQSASKESKAFEYTDAERQAIMNALKDYLGWYDPSAEDNSITWYYSQAYSQGLIQAANMMGKDRPLLDILKNQEIYAELVANGFQLVKDNATRVIKNEILDQMELDMTQGVNPRDVAAHLAEIFGDQNADWERLARTEMSHAAETAKLDEWEERGVEVDHLRLDVQEAAALGKNEGDVLVPVHPRCRCSITVEDDGNGNFKAVFAPAPDACDLCLSLQEGEKRAR